MSGRRLRAALRGSKRASLTGSRRQTAATAWRQNSGVGRTRGALRQWTNGSGRGSLTPLGQHGQGGYPAFGAYGHATTTAALAGNAGDAATAGIELRSTKSRHAAGATVPGSGWTGVNWPAEPGILRPPQDRLPLFKRIWASRGWWTSPNLAIRWRRHAHGGPFRGYSPRDGGQARRPQPRHSSRG
jgi:hypothetical protein